MNDIYLASNESLSALSGIGQGFQFDIDDQGLPVILIKLEAALLESIIRGCIIEIVIENPQIFERSATLYIYDDESDPFWIQGAKLSSPDKTLKDFDEVAIKIASTSQIRLVLFSYSDIPIDTKLVSTNADKLQFGQWLLDIYKQPKLNEPVNVEVKFEYPANYTKGLKVIINNFDNHKEEKTTVTAFSISNIKSEIEKETFNFGDYVGDGKHGYHQEISIKNLLSRYFTNNQDLFISPFKKDGNEFTDFTILLDDIALLIESKYILSNKKANFKKLLTKATNQLIDAHLLLQNGEEVLENKYLQGQLWDKEYYLKICLVNDRIQIDDNSCKFLTNSFYKSDLPIFISVTTFAQMLGILKNKSVNSLKNTLQDYLMFRFDFHLNSNYNILYISELNIS